MAGRAELERYVYDRPVCDRKKHAQKVSEARKLRSQVPANLRPLFNHAIKMSIHSLKVGYCQRAGRELAYARKLARMR